MNSKPRCNPNGQVENDISEPHFGLTEEVQGSCSTGE